MNLSKAFQNIYQMIAESDPIFRIYYRVTDENKQS